MKYKDFKNQLLQDPEFAEEYYSKDLAKQVSKIVFEARVIKHVTQKELARLMSTHQSGIARAETGKYLPSLRFLKNMAAALGTYLIPPKFGFMEESPPNIGSSANVYYTQFGSSPEMKPRMTSETKELVVN